jgi:guanylate kinase
VSLSPETLTRLEKARKHEDLYVPNEAIQRKLGSRSLTMVVAPTAAGKTLAMQRVSELDPTFGLMSVVGTRTPRPDDLPGLFRPVPNDDKHVNELLDKVDTGTLMQYMVHPSEKTIYATELEDARATHNLLATLSTSIDHMKTIGFGHTAVVGLVPSPGSWKRWFNERYSQTHEKRHGRLIEAQTSYTNLLARDDVHWVINYEGEIDKVAQAVIAASTNKSIEPNPEAEAFARRILQLIEDELALEYTKAI